MHAIIKNNLIKLTNIIANKLLSSNTCINRMMLSNLSVIYVLPF